MKNTIFEENPRLAVVFMTSDGQAFYEETDAKSYARSLVDKVVEKLENLNLFEVDAEVETGESQADVDAKAAADAKVAEDVQADAKIAADAQAEVDAQAIADAKLAADAQAETDAQVAADAQAIADASVLTSKSK